ncbi:MAG: hypothetical protein NVS2B17_16510 [Candidatus Velthaea sp.]
MTIPAATSGNGSYAVTLSATATGVPVLQNRTRLPQSVNASAILGYVDFQVSGTIIIPQSPSFTLTFPSAPQPYLYIAYYNGAAWQGAFLGPGIVANNSVSFAANQLPMTFSAGTAYAFALYQVSAPVVSAPAPPVSVTTPGPALAYMSAGIQPNTYQSAIGTSYTNGVVINASSTQITTTSSNPSILTDAITTTAGSSVSTFGAARSPLSLVPQDRLAQVLLRRSNDVPFGPELAPDADVDAAFRAAAVRAIQSGARASQHVPLQRRTTALKTTIGMKKMFAVNTAAIGQSGSATQPILATLAAISSHGYIFVDNALNLDAATTARIGAIFDSAYGSDQLHFGSPEFTSSAPGYAVTQQPCDPNGTPIPGAAPVPVLIPPPNNMHTVLVASTANLGSGLGGYFSAVNHFAQTFANCIGGHPISNETSMIVVGWNPANSVSYELEEDMARGTAHEFQHLINFVDHVIVAPTAGNEDRWINEGLSMLAQDFNVRALNPQTPLDVADALRRANEFLAAPQNFSLTGFTGIDPDKTTLTYNCSGCYGAAYLFQRYLYDRFGNDTYLHAMESDGLVGFANLRNATGIAPATLNSDFAVALAAAGTSISYDPRFGFTTFNPLGTYTDQFGTSHMLAGVGLTSTITGGSSASNNPYLGTFYYTLIKPVPGAGAGVTVQDTGGAFSLTSALLQF